ncbi:D-glycero-beta-D-manno-heptose 1,7-bisphosphate 7-phosphatase [Roseateles saccharophilus]|uniref:D,D-heptose 1,7-bisphosphate phosphatase n=1 Tax=Roseateles saccharophilus TaxID=304 RepID=A0A4R3V8M6_ROSSA|nr:D-glycero-beta-D-manno-heptose 1,7-bisphosphate 7-phosphatase [Roseateles saccharophilus]MDG0832555.1 D-glycero-beta-D-manno-heptose 1,7-bisphosphate 7-phosphatase [Roseateles saccharophilus]TCV00291.1 D-glycero-D-manno-heptose 1,7-bisphosphate phosphatase [Roseateles saccharophilus]
MFPSLNATPGARRKAAFLDRDGVINIDHGYVYRWEDFAYVPGVVQALLRLQAAGYALVIVTNQSGIARGYYDEAALQSLHDALRTDLVQQGVTLDAIEYCPHLPDGSVARYAVDCDCRKPAPGMLLRSAKALGIALADSLMFGDKFSDIEAGRAAGVGRCLRLAKNGEPGRSGVDHPDLPQALDALGIP